MHHLQGVSCALRSDRPTHVRILARAIHARAEVACPRLRGHVPRPGSLPTKTWACHPASSEEPSRTRSFEALQQRRIPQLYSVRGSKARPVHEPSTLRRPGRPATTQDTLPVAGQALPGGGWYPAESQRKASAGQSLPPFPSFPGGLEGESARRIGGPRCRRQGITSMVGAVG